MKFLLMFVENLAQFVSDPGWRWLLVLGSAILGGITTEYVVRKGLRSKLAPAAAVVTGALGSTICGSLLFPPLSVATPNATVFSIVGASVCVVYCIVLQFLMPSKEEGATGGSKPAKVLLLYGVGAGVLTGLLAGNLLALPYCIGLGAIAGLLLAAPYLFAALLGLRNPKHGRLPSSSRSKEL